MAAKLHVLSDPKQFIKEFLQKPIKEYASIESSIGSIDAEMYKDLHFPIEYKAAVILPFLAPILIKYPMLFFKNIWESLFRD